ncbi:hypothetical protein [Legionella maioricensis]|uniref:Uncharacterized protein n=1 Tax=Legionella maioricensis TaxID=2896528 RepID=A0A9X2CZT8_9GAMM|nr:hypothetical protein [Legionella maioricensis]MCL9683776.1 hypothetical protein [Legionella maioricensis]MCL9686623.1 hypothetical protein [Legionella maioricensis]
MQNSIIESYAAWLKSYIKNKDNKLRSTAQKMLNHLQKDISLDELIDLVKETQAQQGIFLSDDPLILKLQEWQISLSKRKETVIGINSKAWFTNTKFDQVQPLLNLIAELFNDPRFLMHQRALLIFSNVQEPRHFGQVLLHIMEQPVVLQNQGPTDEGVLLSDDYEACVALLNNHLCTFDEKNKLSLAANSLLINVTEIYKDLHAPMVKSSSCNLL